MECAVGCDATTPKQNLFHSQVVGEIKSHFRIEVALQKLIPAQRRRQRRLNFGASEMWGGVDDQLLIYEIMCL